jgi:hypothetical protein
LRGSGVPWDLRKVAPYDKYDEVGAARLIFVRLAADGCGPRWNSTFLLGRTEIATIDIYVACRNSEKVSVSSTRYDFPFPQTTHLLPTTYSQF